ncbi:MAG: polyprenyl synthetase family protein [Alphaproteobacteria bacterium]|nr:polyprenyl synthetase family protein [Alphaproteobacteria bacterium]
MLAVPARGVNRPGRDDVALPANADQGTKNRASLDRLNALVASDLAQVNTLILERMQSPVALIPQLAGHIIAAGGKRLRPMLTLACSRLCGYRGDRHLALAAAVEFIHTATLLHDDVVDASGLRRGLATANAVWGNKPSVLVGDFLFSRAFQLMVEDGSLKVLDILSRASAVIAEGEVLQLVTSNDTDTTEAQYLEVINAKTAALFAAASRIGAVLGERKETEEKALEAYGRNLGIAFQLVDDMLDYSARQAELGKTVGDDFRDGKITLPVVLALKAADDAERMFWRRTLEAGEQRDGDLERAIALMQRHETLAATLERARLYAETARGALGIFHESPERRALDEAIDFCLERNH